MFSTRVVGGWQTADARTRPRLPHLLLRARQAPQVLLPSFPPSFQTELRGFRGPRTLCR